MKLGRERASAIAQQAVESARKKGARSVFAMVRTSSQQLTRYSNNAIENSTDAFEPSLYLRVAVDGGLAAGSVGQFDEQAIDWLASLALDRARSGKMGSAEPRLAPPASAPTLDSYDEATAMMSPSERAKLITRAISQADGRTDVKLYGNAVTGFEERALANSRGMSQYFLGSVARFQATALADSSGAGLAKHAGRSMEGVMPEALARAALDKASRFRQFATVPPGDYEVILEPPASAELLFHLGYLGFGGLGHLQGSSCFTGQIGTKALSPNVTILDDPLRPGHMCETFDWEGVPRQCVCLVERGVIKCSVHDLETAEKAGTASTGHALPPEGAWFSEGPFPSHMVLVPGDTSPAEMISRVKRGLLVTSFHYTRPLDPRQAILTGMTRNGTFLIEDGEVRAMLPNLRFTLSAIALLRNVVEVGNDLTLSGDYFYNMSPSIRTAGFAVTGKTAD